MRTLELIGLGFGRTWKIKGPVALIGLYNLLLALLVTAPVYNWFLAHLRRSRDTSQLLDGPAVRFLFELGGYDRTNVFSLVWTSFFWTAVGGFLVAVFLAAGLFAVSARPDARPQLQYFFASAARFFPRFLALGATVGAVALIIVLFLNVVLAAVSFRLSQNSNSDMLPIWLVLIQAAVSGAFILYLFLILDYSRVDIVVHPERTMLRALLNGFLLVSRRFVSVFGTALVFILLLTMLFGIYLVWRLAGSIAGTTAFLLTLVLQQVVVFSRYGLRAAMIGSEVGLHAAYIPAGPTSKSDSDAEIESELRSSRRRERLYARALRREAPPRANAVGALRRNLRVIRRRHRQL